MIDGYLAGGFFRSVRAGIDLSKASLRSLARVHHLPGQGCRPAQSAAPANGRPAAMSSSKQSTKKYVEGIPKSVARGMVLAHNHVVHGPDWPCGVNGFRAWTEAKRPAGFVLCPCRWSGLRHYAARRFVEAYRENPERYWRSVRVLEREWGLLN